MLGNTLFMATIDSKLIALDAITGQVLWQKTIADASAGYAMTLAPLVVKDKIIIGVAGGEYGIRGFIAAHDAVTGEEEWRFYTIPAPGEPGFETWADGGDAWKYGGASVWLTGSYDASLDLTYWGIGNPGPDWNPAQRPGDNLYSDSVVALDPDTGELKWHFQFTPNDDYDYDAVQIPVLVDLPATAASSGKLMYWANRNGFFYVLDRTTGEFIRGNPFVNVNWASGLDETRPAGSRRRSRSSSVTYPRRAGRNELVLAVVQPAHRAVLPSAWENYGSVFRPAEAEYQAGRTFVGGIPASPLVGATIGPRRSRGPINNWTEALGNGAVVALDPRTGEQRWRFPTTDVSSSGILTTATDLVFTASRDGYAYALDARTGELLWRVSPAVRARTGPCPTPSTATIRGDRLGKRAARIRITRLASRFRGRSRRHIQ